MRNTKNENFKIYDYRAEYNDYESEICHIIATNLTEDELVTAMKDVEIDIADIGKYIIIPLKCAEAFNCNYRNDEKFSKRESRKGNPMGYEDGETELHHKELIHDDEVIKTIIDKADISSNIKYRRMVKQAMRKITVTQYRRLELYYKEEKTLEEIAELENCSATSIHYSLKAAIKKIRKLCNVDNA